MPYNGYELKCYSNCLVVSYTILARVVGIDVSFKKLTVKQFTLLILYLKILSRE